MDLLSIERKENRLSEQKFFHSSKRVRGGMKGEGRDWIEKCFDIIILDKMSKTSLHPVDLSFDICHNPFSPLLLARLNELSDSILKFSLIWIMDLSKLVKAFLSFSQIKAALHISLGFFSLSLCETTRWRGSGRRKKPSQRLFMP